MTRDIKTGIDIPQGRVERLESDLEAEDPVPPEMVLLFPPPSILLPPSSSESETDPGAAKSWAELRERSSTARRELSSSLKSTFCSCCWWLCCWGLKEVAAGRRELDSNVVGTTWRWLLVCWSPCWRSLYIFFSSSSTFFFFYFFFLVCINIINEYLNIKGTNRNGFFLHFFFLSLCCVCAFSSILLQTSIFYNYFNKPKI